CPTQCIARAPVAKVATFQSIRFLNTTSSSATYSEDKDCIAVINFNRPKAYNALSRKFVREFREALQELRYDQDARAVIIRSLVDGAFCAGADLRERSTMNLTEVKQFLANLRDSFRDLETLPIPRLLWHSACDMRVGGGNKKVKIGLVETRLAIIPGRRQHAPRLIGIPKAKELISRILNHAVMEDSGYDKALEIAVRSYPWTSCYPDSGLEYEQACLAAFREKRKPIYKGK
ncbi:ClpP/crotonase-like domain-containing protein, partial [Lobosporangium transversale]